MHGIRGTTAKIFCAILADGGKFGLREKEKNCQVEARVEVTTCGRDFEEE
jgi:hypothetical protein